MNPRRRSAVLWGAVGALAFLSLHQAYLLVGGAFVGVGPLVAVAAAVFAATAVATYLAERRFGLFVRRFRRGGNE